MLSNVTSGGQSRHLGGVVHVVGGPAEAPEERRDVPAVGHALPVRLLRLQHAPLVLLQVEQAQHEERKRYPHLKREHQRSRHIFTAADLKDTPKQDKNTELNTQINGSEHREKAMTTGKA